MAEKLFLRTFQIKASKNINDLLEYSIGRCHPLHSDRKGQYALDLVQPYRLIFTLVDGNIEIVCILEITDYH